MSVCYVLVKVDREIQIVKVRPDGFLSPWVWQNVGALLIGPAIRGTGSDVI